MEVAKGNIKRLIVEMPVRHGKSELCSRYFPAWWLGQFPDDEVMVAAASQDKAKEHARASRDLMTAFGQECFGVEVRQDVHAADHWQLTAGGILRGVGVGTSVFGVGARLLVIDDYFGKIHDALSEAERQHVHQWFYGTVQNRLTPDGAIVMVASRTHPKDLTGVVLEDMKHGGTPWMRLRFPAIAEANDLLGRREGEPLWPERWNQKYLDEVRNGYVVSGYEWMWEALYQENPPQVLDAEWPAEYFADHIWFDEWPSNLILRVMALDPSVGQSDKADYSAYVLIGVDQNLDFWIEADLARRDIYRMVNDGLDLYQQWQPVTFGVEAVAFQHTLMSVFVREAQLRGMNMPNVSGITHSSKIGKIQRIRANVTSPLARRKLHFRRNSPGCNLLIEQMRGFPTCKHDDGPDVLSMGIDVANSFLAERANGGPRDDFGGRAVA